MALDLPFPAICPFLALSRPCHALPFPSSEVAAADRYGATVRFFTVGMGTTCGSDAAKGQTDCSRPFRELNSVVKVPPWQCPISAPAPPQGAPGSSDWPGAPRGETGPLGAQPLPRVLELAASKAAHFTAFEYPGAINGWLVGIHPPGGQGQLRTTVRVIWHMLLGHREVSRAIREAASPVIAGNSDRASGASGDGGGAGGAGAAPCIMIANNIVWFEAKWRWNLLARLVTQLVNLAFNYCVMDLCVRGRDYAPFEPETHRPAARSADPVLAPCCSARALAAARPLLLPARRTRPDEP